MFDIYFTILIFAIGLLVAASAFRPKGRDLKEYGPMFDIAGENDFSICNSQQKIKCNFAAKINV